jgi:murein L,D-transpeptidase YafK
MYLRHSWGIVSMRWLLALFCLSFVTVSQASFVTTVAPANSPLIEKVLVLKSAHQLQLIADGKPLKTYRISLGKGAKKGPKLIEGDKRTPEGFYWIDWRKTSDKFNLSMHISYPNISDSARARREGVEPGGMIMIHGTRIRKKPRKTCSTPSTGPTAASPCATSICAKCGAWCRMARWSKSALNDRFCDCCAVDRG